MKRILAASLVLALLVMAFPAVLAEEAPTFKVLSQTMVSGYPENDSDNVCLNALLERTGVRFAVEGYSSADDYNTKLQLYIAGTTLPDVWYGSVDQVLEWKEQGIIIPITELFEKHGQNMKPYMYPSSLAAFTYDDELWALPSMYFFDNPGNEANSHGPIIRKDWLEKLNLEIPTTLDELHTVLTAFSNNDPDGNGAKDTYGMGSTADILDVAGNGMNLVYNTYGITPKHWYLRDGKAVKGFMTDEFKAAVAVLRDWYAQGLIDPEFPVMASNNLEEKLINSNIGVAFSHAWMTDSADPREQSLRAMVPEADLVGFSSVKGESESYGIPPSFGSFRNIVISAQCKDPDALMKALNWFAMDVENWLLSENGIRGTHWDWDVDGNFARIEPYNDPVKRYEEGFANPTRIQTMVDRRYNTQDVISAIATFNAHVIDNAFWGTVPAMTEYLDIETDVAVTTLKVIQGELALEELDAMQARYLERGGQMIADQVNAFFGK